MTATFALRSIAIKDYALIDGHRVGRIRYAGERTNEVSLLTTACLTAQGRRCAHLLQLLL
jgi:hypothetical protein